MIGIVEEPKPVFECEHAIDGLVNLLLGKYAVSDERLQTMKIRGGAHFDVTAVFKGHPCSLSLIFCNAVDD